DDRVAGVRQGQALTEGRGPEGFAAQEDLCQEISVEVPGQRHSLYHRPKGRWFILSRKVVKDPAGAERLVQARRAMAVAGLKKCGRDLHLPNGGPLQEFGRVEAVLVVDLLGRQAQVIDPAVDLILAHVEKSGNVADR